MKLINLQIPGIDKEYKDLLKDILIVFIYSVFLISVYLTLNIKEITWRELLFFLFLLVLFHRLVGEKILSVV
jgi:hypothetical protein